MKRILILAAVTLAGCASPGQKTPRLFESFEHYRAAIAAGDIAARRDEFFAPSMSKTLDAASRHGAYVLTIGHYIRNEQSHYEKIEHGRGCLTVNGYDQSESDPVSLFFEYQPGAEGWRISEVYLYSQEKQDFEHKALCPDEARAEIARKIEARARARGCPDCKL
jgi:hypothetical protein